MFAAVHCEDSELHSIRVKAHARGRAAYDPRAGHTGSHILCLGEAYFLREAVSQRTLDPGFNVITQTLFKSGPHSHGRTADAHKTQEVNTAVRLCLCVSASLCLCVSSVPLRLCVSVSLFLCVSLGRGLDAAGQAQRGDPEQGGSCREMDPFPRELEVRCQEPQRRPCKRGAVAGLS